HFDSDGRHGRVEVLLRLDHNEPLLSGIDTELRERLNAEYLLADAPDRDLETIAYDERASSAPDFGEAIHLRPSLYELLNERSDLCADLERFARHRCCSTNTQIN